MNNNLETQKGIVRMKLHQIAANPPKVNPFTGQGTQAWVEYTDLCRSLEMQLCEMGDIL